jgi:cob(I)alamin adenosyltransferase
MKIYTKTGDDGSTGLSGGSRVSKSHLRIAAIGDVDEANALLGVCRTLAIDSIFELRLTHIQSRLFDIGAELSCPPNGKMNLERLDESEIKLIEDSIDLQTDDLEPLRHFILPGGSSLGATFHLARTVSRRAERSLVALSEVEPVRPIIIQYMNRLSDWLFISARTANRLANVEDIRWNVEV